MDNFVGQRICLKFYIANDIFSAESLKMLQEAFWRCALLKIRIYEWYKDFKRGRLVGCWLLVIRPIVSVGT